MCEFSSGVSICRNKGTKSDLGASFPPGAPWPGDAGGLPPALVVFNVNQLIDQCL